MQFDVEVRISTLFKHLISATTLQIDSPDFNKIPNKQDHLFGVTAMIITVSFKETEFLRIGYYVYNFYTDPLLAEHPPSTPQIDKVTRNILSDKPRITSFDITQKEQQEDQQFQMIRQKLMQTQKQNSHLGKDIVLSHKNEKEEFEEIDNVDADSEESKEEEITTTQNPSKNNFVENDVEQNSQQQKVPITQFQTL